MSNIFNFYRWKSWKFLHRHTYQTRWLGLGSVILLLLITIGMPIVANLRLSGSSPVTVYATSGITHYVSPQGSDSNPGTQELPWQSWHKAAASTNPGETTIFLDGTYTEDSYSYFAAYGTAEAPVIFRSQHPLGAKIVFGAGANNTERIYVTGTYYTFDGFAISSTAFTQGSSADNGFRFWTGANHGTVKNCSIYNMMIAAKSNADYTLFDNNQIGSFSNPSPGALEFLGNVGGVMSRNTVYYSSTYAGALNAKGGARSVQINDNVVHIIGDSYLGIDVGGFSDGRNGIYDKSGWEISNSVAFNNVVVVDAGGRAYGGIGTTGGNTIGIYNNVVIGAERGIYTDWGGEDIGVGNWTNTTPGNRNGDPPVVNVSFLNNIILNSTQQAAEIRGLQTGTSARIDYNDFFNNAGSSVSQTHPVTGNPQFINVSSDWHVAANSPILNKGATIPDFIGYNGEVIKVSFDYNNLTRTTPWDLGIYESDGATLNILPNPTTPASLTLTPKSSPTATPEIPPTLTPTPTIAPTATPTPQSVSPSMPTSSSPQTSITTFPVANFPDILIPILVE